MESIITIFLSVMTSSGVWTYINNRSAWRKDRDALLKGLASSQLFFIVDNAKKKGYTTPSEVKEFENSLWIPYKKMGGNGFGERLHEEFSKIPVKNEKE